MAQVAIPKNPKKEIHFPKTDVLKKIMDLIKSAEVAEYFNKKIKDIAANSSYLQKNPDLKKTVELVLETLSQFAKNITYQSTQHADTWAGEIPKSPLVNLQTGIAQNALDELGGAYKDVKLTFAINNEGCFTRKYEAMSGGSFENQVGEAAKILHDLVQKNPELKKHVLAEIGVQDKGSIQVESIKASMLKQLDKTKKLEDIEALLLQIGKKLEHAGLKCPDGYPLEIYKNPKILDDKTATGFDMLFNAWLAEKDIRNEKGFFYKKESNGNEIKLNADEVAAVINDSEHDFADYLEDKGIRLSTEHLKYTAERPRADGAPLKEELSSVKQKVEQEPTPASDIEPSM